MKLHKTALFAITLISILIVAAGCQEVQKKVEPQPQPTVDTKIDVDQPAPRIEVENLVHDFGVLGPGASDKCEFIFKNTGDAVLKISRIQSTCGCTVPKLAKNDYAPGESGVVKVTFKSPVRAGSTKKHLYIHSNDPETPKFQLTVKAKTEIKIDVTPDKLNPIINKENAGIGPITLKSKDGKPFAIKGFDSPKKTMTADFAPNVTGTEFVIQPKVDIEKLKKNLKGNITIKLSHPQCDQVNISYSTLPAFQVTKNGRLIIQNAEPEKTVRKEIWIKSNYDDNFEIESIISKNEFIKVLKQEKEGSTVMIEVEITSPKPPKETTKYFTDNLTIKIKGEEEMTVRCIGWYPKKSAAEK